MVKLTIHGQGHAAIFSLRYLRSNATRMQSIDAPKKCKKVAFSSIEEMIYFVHITIVTITLLPTRAKTIATEKHCEGLCYPTTKIHVDSDVSTFLTLGEISPATVVDGFASTGIETFAAMEANRIVGVRLHEVNLLLKFEWVSPIVVTFTIGYIFPTSTGIVERDVHLVRVPTGVLVLSLVYRKDNIGMPFGVLSDDSIGAVG